MTLFKESEYNKEVLGNGRLTLFKPVSKKTLEAMDGRRLTPKLKWSAYHKELALLDYNVQVEVTFETMKEVASLQSGLVQYCRTRNLPYTYVSHRLNPKTKPVEKPTLTVMKIPWDWETDLPIETKKKK